VRLGDWMRFATAKHSTRRETHGIDAWFRSVLNRSVKATPAAMEDMSYKAALRHGYFDLQSAWSWYLRRSEDRPHGDSLRRFIEVQTKILAPFAPHVAEEIWHRIGGEGLVVDAAYPEVNEKEIDSRAEAAEALLQSTLSDIREIRKVTGLVPKRIALYTAPSWKSRVHEIARGLAGGGSLSMNVLMEKALSEPGMRDLAKEVAAYAKQVAEELRHARPEELDRFGSADEFATSRDLRGVKWMRIARPKRPAAEFKRKRSPPPQATKLLRFALISGIVFMVLLGIVFIPQGLRDQSPREVVNPEEGGKFRLDTSN